MNGKKPFRNAAIAHANGRQHKLGNGRCKYFLTQHIKIRNTFNGGDLR